MRFLKNKIAKALNFIQNLPSSGNSLPEKPKEIKKTSESKRPTKRALPKPQPVIKEKVGYSTPERARATKNLLKNYGKAICSFAISELAHPYLLPIIEKEKVEMKDFSEFVFNIKENIDSIQTFRAVLLINESDSREVKAYKKMFAAMGEVFIKYFSVNWIFSGRITHKEAHLKFRFRMLRRIQDPESFTYILKTKKEVKLF